MNVKVQLKLYQEIALEISNILQCNTNTETISIIMEYRCEDPMEQVKLKRQYVIPYFLVIHENITAMTILTSVKDKIRLINGILEYRNKKGSMPDIDDLRYMCDQIKPGYFL